MAKESESEANDGKLDADPFARTELLWRALIEVEVETDILVQEMRRAQQVFDSMPPSEGFWYAAPPEDDRDPELRALIEERRSEQLHEDRHHWAALDRYHTHARRWRKKILEAKSLADAATFELDPPSAPVFSRITVGVKRALQNLGGSVPSPMSGGDLLPTHGGLYEDIRRARLRVSKWINDLRLVLIPRAPPMIAVAWAESGIDATARLASRKRPKRRSPRRGKRAARSQVKVGSPVQPAKPKLGRSHVYILRTLQENKVTNLEAMWSAQKIADKALGPESFQLAKKRCTELRKANYLAVKGGRRGGYWITSEGLVALREATGSPDLGLA